MKQLTLNKLEKYNIFVNKENRLILKALLLSASQIKIFFKQNVNEKVKIRLYNHQNILITSYNRFQVKSNEIILKGSFNLNVNYFLKINNEETNVILNPEIGGILDTHFFTDNNDFGVIINDDNTASFRLWSPPAVRVELLLFDKSQNNLKFEKPLLFNRMENGIWELTTTPTELCLLNLDEIYYQYKITAYGKERLALDPYAKSMAVFNLLSDDVVGKAAILNMNSKMAFPKKFNNEYKNFKFIENETDIIAYEINIRDFSIQKGFVDEQIAGTFKGLTNNVKYLEELGITHVQLMPVNKAYTQNELNKNFTNKYSEQSNYNWGYDPMNYFTIEGRYSTNPFNPFSRIAEFREMIQALHDVGIGVIIDVVFNHTYIADAFENIAPACYYRHKENCQISGHTGAGATLESRRKQVRKFIIDVLKFYVKEYHIDGFRFDLMSFHDKETMKQIRNDVGLEYNHKNKNELILQGEAWNFTDLNFVEAVVKTNFDSQNIAVFNDTFRDAIAGDGKIHGFIHGNTAKTSALASALVAGVNSFDNEKLPFNKDVFFNPYNLFANEPKDCLNFMSVHDGLTLWDKINLTVKDESKKERLRLMKFAYAILLTSQGKIILHGGDEILRTKALADFDKEKHRAFTSEYVDTELNTKFFHENSYSSNDYTNMFRWDRLENEYSEFASELLQYVKALINMRRQFSELRFNSQDEINKSITFLDSNYSQKNYIHSFKSNKLQKLKIKFINGIANEKLFLVGEIHKEKDNPTNNNYILDFDENGNSEIIFNKKEIEIFDLQKWDNSRNLNFKLVKTPNKWDFNYNFYSQFGYNSVSPEAIDNNSEVTIDLAKTDFKVLEANNFVENNFISYVIENKKFNNGENNSNRKMLIVYNASHNKKEIKYNKLTSNSYIIADDKSAGISELKNSNVELCEGIVKVPRKSCVVIII